VQAGRAVEGVVRAAEVFVFVIGPALFTALAVTLSITTATFALLAVRRSPPRSAPAAPPPAVR
jgi:hypothetical protein